MEGCLKANWRSDAVILVLLRGQLVGIQGVNKRNLTESDLLLIMDFSNIERHHKTSFCQFGTMGDINGNILLRKKKYRIIVTL